MIMALHQKTPIFSCKHCQLSFDKILSTSCNLISFNGCQEIIMINIHARNIHKENLESFYALLEQYVNMCMLY